MYFRQTCIFLPAFFVALLVFGSQPARSWKPRIGSELIGTAAPEFAPGLQWLNCKPITMKSLKGKPVFLRFWLANCPLCRGTFPTLRYLDRTYSKRGLVVLAIEYRGEVFPDQVKRIAEQESMNFPVAFDPEDKTSKIWWWNKDRSDPESKHGWWAPSFLIDRNGRIRWVHDGGELALSTKQGAEKASPAFDDLTQKIDQLFREK